MGPRKCEVCEQALSKYKCPTCLIPYCSLVCFKKHKEIPCAKSESVNEGKAHAILATNESKPCYVDEQSEVLQESQLQSVDAILATNESKPCYVDEQSEVLQESQLQSVASSNEICDSLKDEKLRKLINNIDSSADPENDLDKAMDNEEFRLFTEKILSTIGA